ncbi:MAG: acyltransferase [Richelia sp. RM2_1_2]|nr:acyltransferase [Richelia sp. SM2_1_7]NJM18066.1 acyltransferase [Richelia sp. SM1_7_0]NJN07977.1 acyltransferase [Richelia sp. RM1_1_1]NJO28469.1 acyltransferase [Richelia sp. SL_2_1]NJO58068.1 acyltransferase [Richelia sp. RM2_1_2]
MNSKQIGSKLKRLEEIVLTVLLANIPTKFIGSRLRTFFYRSIFRSLGKQVYLQDSVEFINTNCIEIGNGVQILRGANINAIGHPNNKISIGDGVQIQQGVDIRALNDTHIKIEQDTFIGPYVCIAGPGNIKIGKNCLIAAHSGLFANNHNFTDPFEYIAKQGITSKGIVIEDDCWLGHNVTVIDGVTIGKGCVIGAGSVVTKDIPPYSIAVGTPAKVVKSRLQDKELVNLN